MNLCIPVTEDAGLSSRVSEHFGSAPCFMIVDTDTRNCRAVPNANQHHGHGMCQPMAALAGVDVDAVIVAGIGRGALERLKASAVRVYLARQATVEATVSAFEEGALLEATSDAVCGGHGAQAHGCAHGAPAQR